jgi:trehalose 6-phosphate phosphatase
VNLPRDCALFLDIDGTLLDFAAAPGLAVPPPELPGLLRQLAGRMGSALALISGRMLADIERLFGPGIAVAAEHGACLRDASGRILTEAVPDPALRPIAAILHAAVAARPGALLEEKRFGLTLHWRGAPAWGAELAALAAELAAPHPGLVLLPAHAALEIRTGGNDKASALEAFLRIAPFAGRLPVFVGDDVTDEPAIARANALGGAGLHTNRDFGGPAALRAWLAELAEGREDG